MYPGDHETLKASVHLGLGALAFVCAGYNFLAFLARRESHLAVNFVTYSSLAYLECGKVNHHFKALP